MEQSKTNQFNVLAEKPVGSLLMQYAIPAIVAMAASSVYNIIDGIFIGQGVGAEAIMGLALTGPLMSLTAAFGAMVGVGAATLMSVKLGQKDYGTAQKILGNVVIMNLTLGIVLGLLLLVFINPILRFFGASDVTLPSLATLCQSYSWATWLHTCILALMLCCVQPTGHKRPCVPPLAPLCSTAFWPRYSYLCWGGAYVAQPLPLLWHR